jgi:transposase-like protein
MEDRSKKRRLRRTFTDEFKAGAVALVLDEKKAVAQVADDLDLSQSVLQGQTKY